MKKKFINGFFMVALLFVAVGSFVSCKDTDEDAIAELRGELQRQNATLEELIKAQVATLEGKITNLENAKAACEKECNDIKTRLDAVENTIKNTKHLTKEEADSYYVQIEVYTRKIAELEAAIAKLDGVLDAIESLEKMDKTLQGNIDALESKLTGMINDVNKIATQAAADATEALRLATANGVDITKIKDDIFDIKTTIIGWGERLTQVELDAAAAQATADAAQQAADRVLELLNEHIAKCGGSTPVDIQNQLDEINRQINELKGLLSNVGNNQVASEKYVDDAISAIQGNTTKTLADLEQNFNDYNTANDEKLTEIWNAINALKAAIDGLSKNIQDLVTGIIVQGTINPMIGYMNMPLDMRSTMLAAFCGEETNGFDVIFPTDDPNSYIGAGAAQDAQALTIEEIELLWDSWENYKSNFLQNIASAGGRIFDFEPGKKEQGAYAGTLYVTVNPNTVDFSGQTLTLENSAAEKSAMTLSPLQPSDFRLSFGWTKAGNDNGFYEAKAYVKENDVTKLRARVDFGALKDVAKDLLDNKNGIDLTQLVTTIYTSFSDVLDANAVKASYNSYVYENGVPTKSVTHSVFSNYNLALTSIKPLSYEFSTDGLPMGLLSRRFATIGDITIEFDNNVNFNIDLSGTNTTVPVSGTVKIPEQKITQKDEATGKDIVITIPEQTVPFSTEVELKEILENYAGTITDQMNDQVNQMLEEMQNQVNGKINEYVTQGNNYIKKVNNVLTKFENFVKNIDSKLQPVMLFVDANKNYKRLNDAYLVPTKMKLAGTGESAATLVATSYTAELIAPACKKMVAVTNVLRKEGGVWYAAHSKSDDFIIDDKCIEALNYANERGGNLLCNVVSGSVRDFPFVTNADYADYIFEVSYFALDFSGVQSRTKYYIQPVR